jgi:hypothetical protein
MGRRSYRNLDDDDKDDAENRLISHIASVESTMVGFFATAVTFLLFPLALYTPDASFLMYLVILGYLCSWGFLYTVIAGICMRILAISAKWNIDYSLSMQDLTGKPNLATWAIRVAMDSCVFMMMIPPIYVGFLLWLVTVSNELVLAFVSMWFVFIIGLFKTYRLTRNTIWEKKEEHGPDSSS